MGRFVAARVAVSAVLFLALTLFAFQGILDVIRTVTIGLLVVRQCILGLPL